MYSYQNCAILFSYSASGFLVFAENSTHFSKLEFCNILDKIQPHVAGLQVWEATLSSASSSALSGIESPSCE